MFMRNSGIWPILCQLVAILVKLLDKDFKFALPNTDIIVDIQTNFEVNQTQIGHSISNYSIIMEIVFAITSASIIFICLRIKE